MRVEQAKPKSPRGRYESSPAAVLILQVFLCGCFWFRGGDGFARNGFEPVVHVDQKLSHDRGQSDFLKFALSD